MTATDLPSEQSNTEQSTTLSPRLQQFQAEVDQLKVTGGRPNPERTGRALGVVLMIVGPGPRHLRLLRAVPPGERAAAAG